MDVFNAFLHDSLFETVYMKLPKGYGGIGSRIDVNMDLLVIQSDFVCLLKRSLYGLREAPRLWFDKLSTTLLSMGYKQSKTDYSMFSIHTNSSTTLILVYVDDLLLSGSCMHSIDKHKSLLAQHFHIKDLGQLRYFLGLEVDHSSDGIFLSQRNILVTSSKNNSCQIPDLYNCPLTHM